MKRWWRPTIRVRLTLQYAASFFVVGVALATLTYVYLGQSLDRQLHSRVGASEQHIAEYLNRTAPGELHETLKAQFQRDRDDTMRTMLVWSIACVSTVGLLGGGLGWLLAGRALHPLQRITTTARRVADHSLHERIALAGPDDELKDLADTFDAMLERLDRSFDGQRRFVANASHELRTPLTINRALIEVALDTPDAPPAMRQLGASLLEVNQRHERLIDGLLVLASSEQHLTEHTPVDLAGIARHVADTSAAAASAARVEIRAATAPALVVGDPLLLERLAQNLLDNAIRYNLAEHGWVSISTGTADGSAYFTVENTGPMVPDSDVGGLFEPFHRLAADDRQPVSPGWGAGLGLSIVRSVAHAHRGEVHADPRPDGGLSVQVRIPVGEDGR